MFKGNEWYTQTVRKFSSASFAPNFCPQFHVRKFCSYAILLSASFLSANSVLKSIERLARFFKAFASITKQISIFPVPDLPKISFSSPSFVVTLLYTCFCLNKPHRLPKGLFKRPNHTNPSFLPLTLPSLSLSFQKV